MQKTLSILKIMTALVCLSAAYLGFTFWNIWQQNKPVELTVLSISKDEVNLGDTFKISATFNVPWHRELNVEQLANLPEGLRLIPGSLKVERQKLKMNGCRTYTCQINAIALSEGKYKGSKIEFRLISDRFKKQNSVSQPLPEFTVKAPDISGSELISRTDELNESVLSKQSSSSNEIHALGETSNGLLYMLIFLLAFVTVYYFFRPVKLLPPWEEAYRRLSRLVNHPPESFEIFYLNLTDILKGYTARRFSFNATACSSQEFLQKLTGNNVVPDDQLADIESVLRRADSVKFGGSRTDEDALKESIDRVHRFITSTKPEEVPK